MGAPGGPTAHSSSKLWTESLKGYRIREGSTEKETQSLREREREGERNGTKRGTDD